MIKHNPYAGRHKMWEYRVRFTAPDYLTSAEEEQLYEDMCDIVSSDDVKGFLVQKLEGYIKSGLIKVEVFE